MTLTDRGLNRATLARQMLLAREHGWDSHEAIHRIVALQAQQPASPYLALWNRIDEFRSIRTRCCLQRARSVVKATMMRITLHAALADDYPVFRRGD